MNALNRDIRISHPYGLYTEFNHEPIIKHHGDVYSRVQIQKTGSTAVNLIYQAMVKSDSSIST